MRYRDKRLTAVEVSIKFRHGGRKEGSKFAGTASNDDISLVPALHEQHPNDDADMTRVERRKKKYPVPSVCGGNVSEFNTTIVEPFAYFDF